MCKLITLDDGSLVTEDFINPSKIPENIERFNKIKSMYKVGELKKILKNAGIKGYSKLKEDQLVQLIIDNNLN